MSLGILGISISPKDGPKTAKQAVCANNSHGPHSGTSRLCYKTLVALRPQFTQVVDQLHSLGIAPLDTRC